MSFFSKNALIALNSLKLCMFFGHLTYSFTVNIVPILRNIPNFVRNRCKNCGNSAKIYKKYYKIRDIFNINIKKDVCLDCYLKQNNLEYVIINTSDLVRCSCGNYYKIDVVGNYWSLYCGNCNSVEFKVRLDG